MKRDISKQTTKEFAEKIEESEILINLLESMAEGVLITDPKKEDNPTVFTNTAFTKLTGYKPSEIIGQNCRFLQGKETDAVQVKKIRNAINSQKPIRIRLKNYKKNGEMFWNELSISPVFNQAGQLDYFIGIQRDVTAEEKLKNAQKDFVALVTHQLRTPITTLRLASEMLSELSDTSSSQEVKKYLNYIENSSKRMAIIVRDILNITKLESGEKVGLEKTQVDIKSVIDEIIQDLKPLTEQKGLGVELKDERSKTRRLIADRNLLYQAIYNLVVNAVQYSNSENEKVVVTLKNKDEKAIISVRDWGIGIPKNEQSHIFNRQFRANNAKNHKEQGTGLGLYLAKKIAELHDGTITFESTEGAGTTFFLYLPVKSYNKT